VASGLQAAELRLMMNCTCNKWKNEKEKIPKYKHLYWGRGKKKNHRKCWMAL